MSSQSNPTFASLTQSATGLVFAVLLNSCSSHSAPPPVTPNSTPAQRTARMEHGYLFYLDGAGGGTAKKNWGLGIKQGLFAAGYPGAGALYSWETGDGLMADQDASVAYKRSKADIVAKRIQSYVKAYPDAPADILGFSAGTAVAIFALEALPEDVKIHNMVLLGTSISHDYDMTEALRRVKGKVYIYTSTHDRMLGFLMPFSGTADRKRDNPGAGIRGFVLPAGASAETRKLYADKIVTIHWTKQLEKDADYGRHFDNVKWEFIRDHVAPLLMGKSVPGHRIQ